MFLKKTNLFRVVNCVMILYVLSEAFSFVSNLGQALTLGDNYWITEFLINYQGGFVRRGMLGELLYQIVLHTGINVQWMIASICSVAAIALWAFFIFQVWRTGVKWWILPLCYTLLGMDFIRKDALCMLLAILIIYLLKSNSIKPFPRIILINLTSVVLWNLHEAFFFVIGPFAIYYMLFKDRTFTAFYSRLMAVAPSVISFVVVCYYKGNSETAIAIQNSWHMLYPDTFRLFDNAQQFAISTGPNTSITAIGWETFPTIKVHLNSVYGTGWFPDLFQPLGICVWPFVYVSTVWFVSNFVYEFAKPSSDLHLKSRHYFSALLVFQFISMSPLFWGLSCDIGRLSMYWTTSSLAILFVMGQDNMECMFPKTVTDFAKRLKDWLDTRIANKQKMLVIYLLFVGMPHTCYLFYSFIGNSVIGTLFRAPLIWLAKHYLGIEVS